MHEGARFVSGFCKGVSVVWLITGAALVIWSQNAYAGPLNWPRGLVLGGEVSVTFGGAALLLFCGYALELMVLRA